MSTQEGGGGIRTSDLRFMRRGRSRLNFLLGTTDVVEPEAAEAWATWKAVSLSNKMGWRKIHLKGILLELFRLSIGRQTGGVAMEW
jgi:hypothetical protein